MALSMYGNPDSYYVCALFAFFTKKKGMTYLHKLFMNTKDLCVFADKLCKLPGLKYALAESVYKSSYGGTYRPNCSRAFTFLGDFENTYKSSLRGMLLLGEGDKEWKDYDHDALSVFRNKIITGGES